MKKLTIRLMAIALSIFITASFMPGVSGRPVYAAKAEVAASEEAEGGECVNQTEENSSGEIVSDFRNAEDLTETEKQDENAAESVASDDAGTERAENAAADSRDTEDSQSITSDTEGAKNTEPDADDCRSAEPVQAECLQAEGRGTDSAKAGVAAADEGPVLTTSDDSNARISIADDNNVFVSGLLTQVAYTGGAIRQNITLRRKADNIPLTENTDYTVSYQYPANFIGRATITITGKGNYEGTRTIYFVIYCDTVSSYSYTRANGAVTVSWAAVSGIPKYRVYRKTGNGSWEDKGVVTTASYTDTAAESGKIYSYTVCCLDAAGTALNSYDPYGIMVVGNASVTQVTSGIKTFTVTYSTVTDADGYELRYGLNPDMSDAVSYILPAGQTSFGVKNAAEGIYFVQVRAFKYNNGTTVYGDWCSSRLAKYVTHDIGLTEAQLEGYVAQAHTNNAKKAILYAFSRIGYPYSQTQRLTGAYYDCSSLAWYAWESAGITLTAGGVGTAAEEAETLEKNDKVVTKENLTPGCLVFWSGWSNGRYKNITHVAIYVGNGMVVEAANSRIGVVFRKMDLNGRGTLVVCANPVDKNEVPFPSAVKKTKAANTLKVKAKTVTVKYKKLRKKKQTIAFKKAAKVSKAKGTVTYKKVSGNKKITVNAKTGKITLKKKLYRGTYRVKVKVTAAGNSKYKKGSKTVTLKIRVR